MVYTYNGLLVKRILANNFRDNLNNFLRIRKTHRPPPQFQKTHLEPLTPAREVSRVKINAVIKVSKNRDKKNLNRPITAHLNINSIRNKFQFLEKDVCVNLGISTDIRN